MHWRLGQTMQNTGLLRGFGRKIVRTLHVPVQEVQYGTRNKREIQGYIIRFIKSY